jgi:hypothetical protein
MLSLTAYLFTYDYRIMQTSSPVRSTVCHGTVSVNVWFTVYGILCLAKCAKLKIGILPNQKRGTAT